MTDNLVFIGDRPAQMAALVLDAPVTYTSDRADPFMVQRLVERYMDSLDRRDVAWHLSRPRPRIVLSTGLTWAPKYDGMAARQVNTLIGSARPSGSYISSGSRQPFFTPIASPAFPLAPRVYVLPVSSSHILGHALNDKLDKTCDGSQSRREFSLFLGGAHPLWSFAGDTTSPLSPTPVEILALADVINTLIKLDPK